MKCLRILYLFVIANLVLGSCYYDNEAALYGVEQCSTETVTFSNNVSSIIQGNCIVCHSSGVASGGVVLETHAQIKTQADNGKLIGVVSHASGFSPMPKNAPQLSQCDINAIQQWVEGGALNN